MSAGMFDGWTQIRAPHLTLISMHFWGSMIEIFSLTRNMTQFSPILSLFTVTGSSQTTFILVLAPSIKLKSIQILTLYMDAGIIYMGSGMS